MIDNASQAMRESGGDEINIETRRDGDRMEIIVSDNGPGIPAEVMPKIFEPLFSTKSFGVGLGLPIVERILEGAPLAVRASKETALASLDAPSLASAIETITPAARRMLESEDAREGPRAFAEKRAPRWRGR